MKKFLRNLFSFVLAGCFTVSLASFAAAQSGDCEYLIGSVSEGMTCYYRSQDEFYCYYDCYCTGTQQQCDQFMLDNGLSDV